MGMRPDRAMDVLETIRDGEKRGAARDPRRNADHAGHSGRLRTRHDPLEVAGEILEIEMTMAVDQHGRPRPIRVSRRRKIMVFNRRKVCFSSEAAGRTT